MELWKAITPGTINVRSRINSHKYCNKNNTLAKKSTDRTEVTALKSDDSADAHPGYHIRSQEHNINAKAQVYRPETPFPP